MPVATKTPNTFNYAERVQQFLNEMYAKNPNAVRPNTNADGSAKAPSQGNGMGALAGAVALPVAIKAALRYALKDGTKETASLPSVYEGISPSTTANGLSTPQMVHPGQAPSVPELPAQSGQAAVSPDYLGGGLQTAGGLYTTGQGIEDLRKGNYLGGGIQTLGGANMALQGLNSMGANIAPETVGSIGSVAGPLLAAYGAYNTLKTAGDSPAGGARNTSAALQGAAAGTAIAPGIGTAIGAALGLAASHYGSSKDKYHMMRDQVRDALVKADVLRQDATGHQFGKLADGSEFDFSKDGKVAGKPQFDNPLYGKAASYGNVLATAEGLTGKAREAMATLYANAAVSNAKDPTGVAANFATFAGQRGLTNDAVQSTLDALYKDKKINDNEYQVWTNDKKDFVIPGGAAPTPGFITKPLITQGPSRSKTSSPGISKSGQRISYGKK